LRRSSIEPKTTLDLKGQWALVGGASQGIGQAAARVLAEAGARVILMSRRLDALEVTRNMLPEPKSHRSFAIDLERLEDVSTQLARVVNETGPVAIWVNNTGGPKAGLLHEASTDEMERAFRGHVLASQQILRTLLPGMKELKAGRIINVLSTSVKTPLPNLGVSNIIRNAMAAWAKTLSAELGPLGITVNNILPGFTETPRIESLIAGTASKSGKSEAEVKQAWIETIPARRMGDPLETAQAIAFLASPMAAYISGVSLAVDGGRTVAL
jgi:3-oxoacyl-[acyl-carrier protein] reductase